MTEQEYGALSAIAPTVAEPAGGATPWQEQTRIIGRALGRGERAEELITSVEARLAAARAAHLGFAGASAAIADAGEAGVYYAYGPARNELRFLASLGFTTEDVAAGLLNDEAQLSAERLDVLDTDLLIWYSTESTEPAGLADNALYQRLRVARERRDVFLGYEDPLAGAIAFSSVLSLPYAIDRLVPLLAAAVDGDPATTSGADAEPTSTAAAGAPSAPASASPTP